MTFSEKIRAIDNIMEQNKVPCNLDRKVPFSFIIRNLLRDFLKNEDV